MQTFYAGYIFLEYVRRPMHLLMPGENALALLGEKW